MVMYTLITSESEGLGDFVRLILNQAGLQFEDKKVSETEATALKATSPTASLPILEASGSPISEVNVIARYIGSLYHLYGANALERARIDQVLEQTFRLTNYFHASFLSKEALKASPMAQNLELLRAHGLKKAPEILGCLEKQLNDNGGRFFAGSRKSLADLSAYFFLTFLAKHDQDFAALYANYPALNAHAKQAV